MKKEYLLSIISTFYNHGGYVYDNLHGVFSQTLLKDLPDKAIEWIIIEDGSQDDTAFRIEKHLLSSDLSKLDIKYLRHYTNQGAYASFIDAFNLKPSGKYWTILEGDDFWKPDFLSRTIGYLEEFPDFIGVHADTDYLKGTTLEPNHWRTCGRHDNFGGWSTTMPSGNIYKELIKNNFIMTCAAVFRKSALFYNKLDTFKARGYSMSDYPFYLALAKNHKIGYIDESLAVYRIHDKGASNDPTKREKIVQDTLRIQADSLTGII